jgi:carbonic anhydrase
MPPATKRLLPAASSARACPRAMPEAALEAGVAVAAGCVAALGVHTMLVLGHTKCGAVAAAVDGKDLPGSMPIFVREIRPAIEAAMAANNGKGAQAVIDASIEANVRFQMRKLEESAILRDAKAKGMQVLGAIYDVDTGTVRFLD